MNEEEVHNEYDLLIWEMDQMFFTDDVAELEVLHKYVMKRIERIFDYHCARLNKN